MKGMVTPGTLFEELGFNYIGPIDGHDLPLLVSTLKNMKAMRGPRFLHIVTRRGAATHRPRAIPACIMASPRSTPRPARWRRRPAGDLHPGVLGLALRPGRQPTTAGRGHAGDVRGLRPGRVLEAASASAISTSASPNSTV
jgi:hypothetical protein